MVQTRVPDGTGRTELTEFMDFTPGLPYENGDKPISIFGYTSPDGTNPYNRCFTVQQRGYVEFPGAGTYTFNIVGETDDLLLVWLGDESLSGNFSPGDSQLRKSFLTYYHAQLTYSITVSDTERYLPIRVFYANRVGPGDFDLTISGPEESPQPSLVQCSGTQVAPDWLPWEQEKVAPYTPQDPDWCPRWCDYFDDG